MRLSKKYGFWTVLASTLTAIVGSSIIISFNMVFSLANQNPILMILAWVLGAMIVIPEAMIMIEPSIAYQESGGAYAWIKKCNWKILAFWFGWVLVLFVSATSLAGSCSAMAGIVGEISGIKNIYFTKFLAIAILIVMGAIQILIRNSSKYTQFIFLVAKALPILLVFILALIFGSKDGLLSNENINNDLGKAYVSAALLIPAITYTGFAYSGHEFPTYITAEIENPKKTVPLTIIGAVLIVLVIYVAYGIALLSLAKTAGDLPMNGTSLGALNIPDWAKLTFNIMAIFLFVGSINAFLMFQSRLIHKLAESGDAHAVFGRIYSKSNQPYMAIILLSTIAIFYIIFNDVTQIISSFALATTVLKLLLDASVIKLRYSDKKYVRIYNNVTFWIFMSLSIITAIITLVGSIYLMVIYPLNQWEQYKTVFSAIWRPLLMILVAAGVFVLGFLKVRYENKRQLKNSTKVAEVEENN
ncbi:amino acid permease [Mesoplasma syrphidae]|uniref:Amino acid permease n=1 Tax=Mesoplasma syrphidae TaxID=225999 RepID=A0A2K9BN65_9MOLU|nr:amino acid permease [Mesoplasma syrphidae]AUF83483.1 amino acid permease [Mesoplasma syrphidae]